MGSLPPVTSTAQGEGYLPSHRGRVSFCTRFLSLSGVCGLPGGRTMSHTSCGPPGGPDSLAIYFILSDRPEMTRPEAPGAPGVFCKDRLEWGYLQPVRLSFLFLLMFILKEIFSNNNF